MKPNTASTEPRMDSINLKVERDLHAARQRERQMAVRALKLVDNLSRDFNAELPYPSQCAFNNLVELLNEYEGLDGEIVPEPIKTPLMVPVLSALTIGACIGGLIVMWLG